MATNSTGPPDEEKNVIRSYHGTYLAAAGGKVVFSKPDEAQVRDKGDSCLIVVCGMAWHGFITSACFTVSDLSASFTYSFDLETVQCLELWRQQC